MKVVIPQSQVPLDTLFSISKLEGTSGSPLEWGCCLEYVALQIPTTSLFETLSLSLGNFQWHACIFTQERAWFVCPFKWPHLVSYSWKAGVSLGLVLAVVYVMVMSSCEASRCCCGWSCCGLSLTARVCCSLLNLEQAVLMYFGINVYTCLCTYVAMNLRESKRVHGTEMMELLFPKCLILVRRKLYSTTSTK